MGKVFLYKREKMWYYIRYQTKFNKEQGKRVFCFLAKMHCLFMHAYSACLNFVWLQAVRFSVCGAAVHLFYFRRTGMSRNNLLTEALPLAAGLWPLKNIFKAVDKWRKKLYNSVWYKKGANL